MDYFNICLPHYQKPWPHWTWIIVMFFINKEKHNKSPLAKFRNETENDSFHNHNMNQLIKLNVLQVVSKSDIKTKWKAYHKHSHLEASPRSSHGSDESPVVLFGVVTLHSPQTFLSVVTSCKTSTCIKVTLALWSPSDDILFPLYTLLFSFINNPHIKTAKN